MDRRTWLTQLSLAGDAALPLLTANQLVQAAAAGRPHRQDLPKADH